MAERKITGRVKLPPLGQVGMVVREIDEVMDFYSSVFGIGPWVVRQATRKQGRKDGRTSTRPALLLPDWGQSRSNFSS